MAKEKYIQVGITAQREPGTGEFLPAVPLYIKVEDRESAGEEKLIRDIGALLAERMRRYEAACKAAGVAV